MAHPVLVQFGGKVIGTLSALGGAVGTMAIASAGPAVSTTITAAITAVAWPAAAVVAAGVGTALIIKKISSHH